MILIREYLTFRKLKEMSTIEMNASSSIKWTNISFTINQLWRRALPLKFGFSALWFFLFVFSSKSKCALDITIIKTIQGQPTYIEWVCKLFFIILNILLLYIRNFVSSTFNLICWVLNIIISRQLLNTNNLNILWLKFVYNNMTQSF